MTQYSAQHFEQSHALYREIASVNIVPEEEIICVWEEAPYTEELHEIMELAMDVT